MNKQCMPRKCFASKVVNTAVRLRFLLGLLPATPGVSFAEAPHTLPVFPCNPPPLSCWGPSEIVDEPEGAFYSLGLTLHHLARSPEGIAAFHAWLKGQNQDPLAAVSVPVSAPPAELARIVIDPERGAPCGWKAEDDWIVSSKGNRGPTARFQMQAPRSGLYRVWIRYFGYTNGTAVTCVTLRQKGAENEQPLVRDEFNTRPAREQGPCRHDFMVELEQGEYTVELDHVVRYYHAPNQTPFQEHRVDCLYVTDAVWEDAPSESRLQAIREGQGDGIQKNLFLPLSESERAAWKLWQIRPLDWKDAGRDERAFRLSYAFWRSMVDGIAEQDYKAPPEDPVRKGTPDYRDPRRQVIFDPLWNMSGNPWRIKRQAEELAGDIDPLARDNVVEYLMPGNFPVVTGQWQRSGGGLSADHSARSGLAMGSYRVPHAGDWHVWVQFKNINYFEYFGAHLDTPTGRSATWLRTERNYPGGRSAWAKIGVASIPAMSAAEEQAHKALAAKGVFVSNGEPVFVYQQGEWKKEPGALANVGVGALLARSALSADAAFHISAKVALGPDAISNAPVFFFRDAYGLQENTFSLVDWKLKGPSLEQATNRTPAEPCAGGFSLDVFRDGNALRVSINGEEAASAVLKSGLAGGFGFRAAEAGLRVVDFQAKGSLADGLEAANTIIVNLFMDKYINPRTYRGVYRLMVTDDPDYKPEGNLEPRLSSARYLAKLKAAGATPERGFAMNVFEGLGVFSQTWMPNPEPEHPSISFTLARDAEACGRLVFRSAVTAPLALEIEPGPLKGPGGAHSNKLRWRAVGFVPYGEAREAWSPFLLMRRPFLGLPPQSVAGAWLTLDSTGLEPGEYTGALRVRARTWDGKTVFPERVVHIAVSVRNVAIAPERPILLHGWTTPPAGEQYRLEWFKRFNVWQGKFFSKADMEKYGLQLQIYPLNNVNAKDAIAKQIERAGELGLGYDDWMFSILDEPTGLTAEALKPYITVAKMVRAADPNVKITLNPGEAARAATFKILQPYADLWNPYVLHLSYGPSGKDYLKKPWIWYTTPCYQDKLPGISAQLYEQVRSVVGRPGDCRGTALFAPYYPWRDPWDTAYEHIKDVAVMFLPSRNGIVSTPAWEALLLGVQHAGLARMIRERAEENDTEARDLWTNGSVPKMLDWLEKHPLKH